VTKICESFAGGFVLGGRNLDRPEQLVQGVLLIQKSGEVAQLYGRFGPEYEQFGSSSTICAICAIYANGTTPH